MNVPSNSILIACVSALLLTPICAMIATAKGWMDNPGLRKVHSRSVPYLGGAAVLGAMVVALAALWIQADGGQRDSLSSAPVAAILVGTLLMFLVGFVDDTRNMRPRHKLFAQLAAALLVVSSGTYVTGLQLTDSVRIEFGVFGPLLTLVWIIGVTNAVNIIDGLDGLCGSLAAVACAAIGWTALQVGDAPTAVLMFTTLGAVLGFLPYNHFPARIFLGDAGSLTLGFLLSTSAVSVASSSPMVGAWGVPIVALGLPILDTVFAMTRRVLERRSIMSADKHHIHHRFMALGFGHFRTSAVLASVSLVTVALVAALSLIHDQQDGGPSVSGSFLVPIMGLAALAMIFRFTGALRFRDSLRAVERLAVSARDANDGRQYLDALELRLKDATDVQTWWCALGEAAQSLGLASMELELPRREGGHHRLLWQASFGGERPRDGAKLELPLLDRRSGSTVLLRAFGPELTSPAICSRQFRSLIGLLEKRSFAALRGPTPPSNGARIASRKPKRHSTQIA